MVGASTQALVAQQLGMENFIISRQQITQEKMGWKQKILADLMEAFIAALFIGKFLEFFFLLKCSEWMTLFQWLFWFIYSFK